MELCNVCKEVQNLYATTEHVALWLCECTRNKIDLETKQLKFSAGKWVGRHFKYAWQGAPKGRYVKFRHSKKTQ